MSRGDFAITGVRQYSVAYSFRLKGICRIQKVSQFAFPSGPSFRGRKLECLFNVGSVCFPPRANRMFGFPALGLPRAEGVGSDTQKARGAGVGGSHGAGFRACSLEVCFQMTWAIWCKTRGSKPCDEAGKLTVSHQACRLKFAWCTEIVAYGAAVRA